MNDALFYRPESRRQPGQALALWSAWAIVVLWLTAGHTYWRDEVRALSLALQGDNVAGMLRALHGEGHPALWYLMLRGADALLPVQAVLPAVALVVASASAALLAFRSPFGWPLVAIFLFGRAGIYEYAVMSRNYGISVLLVFAFATLYPRFRDRPLVLGVLLLLLANCNVHSIFIASALLAFWYFDSRASRAFDVPGVRRHFIGNAVLLALGIVLCALTIYPPFNDAAQLRQPVEPSLAVFVLRSLALPSFAFDHLLAPLSRQYQIPHSIRHALMSALLFGAALGLNRRPPAMWASLAAWWQCPHSSVWCTPAAIGTKPSGWRFLSACTGSPTAASSRHTKHFPACVFAE